MLILALFGFVGSLWTSRNLAVLRYLDFVGSTVRYSENVSGGSGFLCTYPGEKHTKMLCEANVVHTTRLKGSEIWRVQAPGAQKEKMFLGTTMA